MPYGVWGSKTGIHFRRNTAGRNLQRAGGLLERRNHTRYPTVMGRTAIPRGTSGLGAISKGTLQVSVVLLKLNLISPQDAPGRHHGYN